MFSFAVPFGIREPFPVNIYPIEGTEAKVTCVAFDPSGNKTAERIQFMRKDNFARYTNVTASELNLQKGENVQCLQQVSCFFLDIPKHAAMHMYMSYRADLQLVHLSS